eukprot:TRINITY_DN8780_c0_g1_i2.p1 TRINITY_DN8780_c0_g1~~TRINITY_DN8780_c0_g1_i2.p1  ORF type:complete len:669 (-),score=121.52 TRINITY_DN8780_c0_g1_i2:42-2048(-)
MAEMASRHFLKKSLDGGKLSLPANPLLDFVDAVQTAHEPPVPYIVETQTVFGQAFHDHVKVEFSFAIQVLTDAWVQIPLLNSSLSVEKVTISGECSDGVFGIVQGKHCFVTQHRGRYVVTAYTLSPYLTDSNCSIELHVPLVSRSALKFIIPGEHVTVSVSPKISFEQDDQEGRTVIEGCFPPTSRLCVQWTVPTEEDAAHADVKKEDMVVTVQNNMLCTLGEGMLTCTSVFEYRIVHGTKSDFQLSLDPRLRVIEVTGAAVKRWETKQWDDSAPLTQAHQTPAIPIGTPATALLDGDDIVPAAAIPPVASSAAPTPKRTLLNVWLDRAVENSYNLLVCTETDLPGTSCEVQIPVITCIGVSKEKGFVSVEARTNVEIEETRATGVARVDVKELPNTIVSRAQRPLLHAYKFLAPHYNIRLNVTKHDDVEVLQTIIDEGWVETTISNERMLTRCVLKVRNTQRQYLRMELPNESCTVWSVLVGGSAVKPSTDHDGKILVPLEKSGSHGGDNSFYAEIVFLMTIPPLGSKGKLVIPFPVFDIPISYLFVSIWHPDGYKFGEWEHPFTQVKTGSFSKPEVGETVQRSELRGFVGGKNRIMPQMTNALLLEDSADEQDSITITKDEEDEIIPVTEGRTLVRGVLPVKIEAPRTKFRSMYVHCGYCDICCDT